MESRKMADAEGKHGRNCWADMANGRVAREWGGEGGTHRGGSAHTPPVTQTPRVRLRDSPGPQLSALGRPRG